MGMMTAALLTVALAGGVQSQGSGAPQPPQAQQPQPQPPMQPRGRGQGVTAPGAGAQIQELQEMFDAFALVQAQRIMQLNDDQYARFFTRMKRMQDLRRQHQRQRMRLVNELRRGYAAARADDQGLAERIRALDDLDTRFELELRTAKSAVDDVLTVRQRAAFRFFEQEMEVQKVDYLTRARQPGRE